MKHRPQCPEDTAEHLCDAALVRLHAADHHQRGHRFGIIAKRAKGDFGALQRPIVVGHEVYQRSRVFSHELRISRES